MEKLGFIQKILKFIVRVKLYMARSMGYIAMLNSAMIGILLLSNLEKYGIDVPIEKIIIPLVLMGIVFLIGWGYFEDKVGLWRYEQTVTNDRNVYFKTITDRLDLIEKRLGVIECQTKKDQTL